MTAAEEFPWSSDVADLKIRVNLLHGACASVIKINEELGVKVAALEAVLATHTEQIAAMMDSITKLFKWDLKLP